MPITFDTSLSRRSDADDTPAPAVICMLAAAVVFSVIWGLSSADSAQGPLLTSDIGIAVPP